MSYIATDEVYRQIKQAIADRSPFSLVRLGDGEARLIGYPIHVSRRELNLSLDYWYGPHKPSMVEVARLRAELMEACRNADVLGIPAGKRQLQHKNRKLMAFLVMKEGLARADTCHCGIHRHLYSEGFLYDLLRNLSRLTIITCRDVRDILSNDLLIKNVQWIRVPEEANAGTPTEPHYPQRHSQVIREIDAGPGDVYLIGAGPNGKVYADAVKRDGGVGLDIGSIFDLWAGVRSRSYIVQELAERREP